MKKILQALYLRHRTYYALAVVICLYILTFIFHLTLWVGHVGLILVLALLATDIYLLFRTKKGVQTQRILPEKLSNGDENPSKIYLQNNYTFTIHAEIIDEVPYQFQMRDFKIHRTLPAGQNIALQYTLQPKTRGQYHFGKLNTYVSTPLGVAARRYITQQGQMVPSYPSFIHLPRYSLMALQNEFLLGGIKKTRRIGHTMEFEQIKDYVSGDDIRSINWKATGKRNQLMVNQYQEEKSQRIYMLIDQGRTMKMPFEQLTLLDYSINAAMALSHIVLQKNDHAGVMTFSRNLATKVPAAAQQGQLRKIADSLYHVQTDFAESDFHRLYIDLKKHLTRRSLIILFSNFETLDAMHRQLTYLRAIAKNHLLVIVFFKNNLITGMTQNHNPENIKEIFDQIIAEKFEYEKKLIRQELQKYGIHSIYTAPENLSIEVINKYLEIKARSLL
ncbi:MAG: DUF58 domain-containing protein [Weeksellaceae bacterium]|nr:DUF58 domain-containing protein [Weeksellaceae bacterium]